MGTSKPGVWAPGKSRNAEGLRVLHGPFGRSLHQCGGLQIGTLGGRAGFLAGLCGRLLGLGRLGRQRRRQVERMRREVADHLIGPLLRVIQAAAQRQEKGWYPPSRSRHDSDPSDDQCCLPGLPRTWALDKSRCCLTTLNGAVVTVVSVARGMAPHGIAEWAGFAEEVADPLVGICFF